jgi:hypothetical protein
MLEVFLESGRALCPAYYKYGAYVMKNSSSKAGPKKPATTKPATSKPVAGGKSAKPTKRGK